MGRKQQQELPNRLRLLYIAITEFPSTNGIKLFAMVGILLLLIATAVISMMGRQMAEVLLGIWLSAFLAMLGIGWGQSKGKWDLLPRKDPPIEDEAAVYGTPEPSTNDEEGVVG